jgi:site-specific recombinase XerD
MKPKRSHHHSPQQLVLDWDAANTDAVTTSGGGSTAGAATARLDAVADLDNSSHRVSADDGSMGAIGDAGPIRPARGRSLVRPEADARIEVASVVPRAIVAECDRAAVEVWILARCEGDADIDLHAGAADNVTTRAGGWGASDAPERFGAGGSHTRTTGTQKNHTALAYRREASRFMLWLSEVRGRDLASAQLEDVVRYRAFLADPQPRARWCGRKGAPVGSPQWRPFEGPLSPRSRRQALVVLKSMFHFLQDQGYLSRNPVTGVAMPRHSSPSIDAGRSLSPTQLALVMAAAAARKASPARDQLAWSVRFLHGTGLRLSEFTQARVESLRRVEVEDGAGSAEPLPSGAAEAQSTACIGEEVVSGGWVLNVMGKGSKPRDVAVASCQVDQLQALVALRHPVCQAGDSTPLVVSWRRDATRRWQGQGGLSAQAFHRQLKTLMGEAACLARRQGRDADAQAIERCSTHWLRHTHGRAAIAAGVELDVVAAGLGHSSLAVTTLYTRPGIRRHIEQARRLKPIS